jgi:hypothetical protein
MIGVLLFCLINQSGMGQENAADNYKSLFSFNTVKNDDGSRLLEVEFQARNKEDRKDKIAVPAAPIKFYNVLEDEEVLLGESNTDKKGIAKLNLAADQEYLTDEDGYINFLAVFEGTDAIDEEEEELMIMDLHLELELAMDHETRMAYVKAYTLDSLGEEVPVEEMDIIVGVESMLSLMPLAEDYLEEGEFEIEVPNDLPGEPNGEIVVIAKVDESDDFGTVFARQRVNWGIREEERVVAENQLWTRAAPLWMYIVLTIMLVGVWANYAYTVVNLRKIKKLGDN